MEVDSLFLLPLTGEELSTITSARSGGALFRGKHAGRA